MRANVISTGRRGGVDCRMRYAGMEKDGVCAVELHPYGRRGFGELRVHFLLDIMAAFVVGWGEREGGKGV